MSSPAQPERPQPGPLPPAVEGVPPGNRPDLPLSDRTVVALLATISACGPIALNIYLPALPVVQNAFAASVPRVQLTLSVAFLAFAAVVVRLFQLQVLRGADYAQTAHENVIRKVAIPTTRGVIRDAQGRVLASSRSSFNVLLVPGRVMPSARPNSVR